MPGAFLHVNFLTHPKSIPNQLTKKRCTTNPFAHATRHKTIPNNASPTPRLSTPYLPWFHLSRAKARRDGRIQGAIGIQERSGVQQVMEGLGVMMAIS